MGHCFPSRDCAFWRGSVCVAVLSLFLFVFTDWVSAEEFHLGVRTLYCHDAARNRPVVVELWYPAAQTEPAISSDSSLDIWVHPDEMRNAPLSAIFAKYPLLLMSHGHQGGRRDASWLAGLLAQEGYIVASMDHDGDTRESFNLLKSMQFWERPLDATFVLNFLQQDLSLCKRIDFERVGFIGYSLGGMTGLALAGAVGKEVKETIGRLNKRYLEFSPKLLSGFDFSKAEQSYANPQIKAILLLAPATFIYSAESLRRIVMPIGLVAAMQDEVLPFKEHAFRIIQNVISAKVKVLKDEASHYIFMNKISEAGKTLLPKVFHKNFETIHREIGLFSSEFFRDTLAQDIKIDKE